MRDARARYLRAVAARRSVPYASPMAVASWWRAIARRALTACVALALPTALIPAWAQEPAEESTAVLHVVDTGEGQAIILDIGEVEIPQAVNEFWNDAATPLEGVLIIFGDGA